MYIKDGIFHNYGDANMTVYNLTYEVYRSVNFQGFIIGYAHLDRCILTDDVLQIVHIDTVYSTLKYNPSEQFFAVLGNWLQPYTTRFFDIVTKNVMYTDRYREGQFVMGTVGRFYENVYYENITLSNSQVIGRPFF